MNTKASRIDFSTSWQFFQESELSDIYNDCIKTVEQKVRKFMWHKDDDDADANRQELLDRAEGGGSGGDGDEVVGSMPMSRQDVMLVFD